MKAVLQAIDAAQPLPRRSRQARVQWGAGW